MKRRIDRVLCGRDQIGEPGIGSLDIRWLTGWTLSVLVGATCSAASAAVLTVGDHGTYPTIQAAINASLGAGSSEIRVERGTYVENIFVGPGFVGDDLEITGGWNAIHTARSSDASLTVIDGGQVDDPVVGIMAGGGSVLVDGFTVTNGFETAGGGFRVVPSGDVEITVSNNRIIGNVASAASVPGGGGVYFRQDSGNGRFLLLNNLISGNTVENTGSGGVDGGGVHLHAHDASSFTATGNRITDNNCVAPLGKAYGCGANLYHDSTGTSEFSDNVIEGNRTATAAGTEVEGAGGQCLVSLYGNTLFVRRNLWIDNRDVATQAGFHVKFVCQGTGTLHASDSVIAGGPDVGVGAWSYDASMLHLTNLTVFDHSDLGVHFRGFGVESSLFNSIVFGSAALVDSSSGSMSAGANLLGVDPLFVNPATWDCRLLPGSPALDEGDNTPPGGIGPFDLDGNPRVIDVVVDIGAFEGAGTIFVDGFESGDTLEWDSVAP